MSSTHPPTPPQCWTLNLGFEPSSVLTLTYIPDPFYFVLRSLAKLLKLTLTLPSSCFSLLSHWIIGVCPGALPLNHFQVCSSTVLTTLTLL